MDDENETDLEETEEDGDMDREMDGDTEDIEGEGDDESMHEVEREEAPSERRRIRLGEWASIGMQMKGLTVFHNHCTFVQKIDVEFEDWWNVRENENINCFDVVNENLMGMIEGLQGADEQRQAEAADQLAAILLMVNEDMLPPHLPIRLGILNWLNTHGNSSHETC